MDIKPLDATLVGKLDFKHPATWLATWFGFGFARPAPGTWGTLAAIPPGLVLLYLGKIPLLVGIVVVIVLGLWSAKKFEQMTGEHDSSIIVIDEVAGFWITLLAASLTPLSVSLAVMLFRLFDILKPWPISWLDRNLKGPWGVMLDDVAAGVASAVCLLGIEYALAR